MCVNPKVWSCLLRPVALAALAWPAQGAALAADIEGAGASFPAPLYLRWADSYRRETGVAVSYEAIGSGAGVDRMRQSRIDFAGTDVPLLAEDLRSAGLRQFPVVIGGVVPVVNIAGLRPGALRLTGEVLGDIYLGKIKRWNDAVITALNPGLDLPAANITVVHRSDASGTTHLWSTYLSKLNPQWRSAVGIGQSLNWPVGAAGAGNEGVASLVRRTRAAIGYVEYAYAKKHRLSAASVRNSDGQFVQPGSGAFAAAAESANRSGALTSYRDLTDAPGPASWPIAGASFVLLRTAVTDAERAGKAAAFFIWALGSGRQAALDLDYVPLSARSLEAALQFPESHSLPAPEVALPQR